MRLEEQAAANVLMRIHNLTEDTRSFEYRAFIKMLSHQCAGDSEIQSLVSRAIIDEHNRLQSGVSSSSLEGVFDNMVRVLRSRSMLPVEDVARSIDTHPGRSLVTSLPSPPMVKVSGAPYAN